MFWIRRVGKPLTLGVVMLVSMRILGFSYRPALICSSIPLALGLLGVFVRFAYSVTGLVLVIAVISTVIPPEFFPWLKSLTQGLTGFLQHLFDSHLEQK